MIELNKFTSPNDTLADDINQIENEPIFQIGP